jgi:hypothetical protein
MSTASIAVFLLHDCRVIFATKLVDGGVRGWQLEPHSVNRSGNDL